MTSPVQKTLLTTLAFAAGLFTLMANESPTLGPSGSLISTAQAIIGRPLTPLSYAGVARRTTRRAYAAGAITGTAAAARPPVVVAPAVVAPRPGCVQVVNSYGQVYWRCP